MIGMGRLRCCLLLVTAAACGCDGSDFPVYSELEGLRVLAIKAEPPAVAEGETAELSALLFDEEGELADARYAWSWCPVREPAALGGECLVSQGDLAEQLGLGDLSFDLGDEPTASFVHAVPAALVEALCSAEAPDGGTADETTAFLPNCDQGLPISVRLDVSLRGQTITTIKKVRLLLEGQGAETNPTIEGVAFAAIDEGEDPDDVDEDGAQPIEEDGSSELQLDERYRIFADVPQTASERFLRPPQGFETEATDKLENLTVAWFVSSGEVDKERTAFTDGASEPEAIRANTWKLPKPGDERARSADLYLVIRDERGGTDWLHRRVVLSR